MAKISAMTEATSLTGTEDLAVVQTSTKRVGVDTLFSSANAKWSGWVYPYTTGWVGTAGAPLISGNWDGDSYSTTAKTKIDLSVIFGVPAGVKAILARIAGNDQGSAAGSNIFVTLSPNNTASSGALFLYLDGIANDKIHIESGIVPCDASGDVYYQIGASGTLTMDVYLEIWGYQL